MDLGERGRRMRAFGDAEGLVGEDPERVFGGWIGGRLTVFDPVDGGEDYEVVRAVEVDPEEAASGAEVDDAAGDGDVAIVVGEDFVGDREMIEDRCGERSRLAVDRRSPEGLRRGEELVEERAEVRVLNEVVFAAVFVAVVGRVLPDPLDVFGGGFFFFIYLRGVDLRGRDCGCQEAN